MHATKLIFACRHMLRREDVNGASLCNPHPKILAFCCSILHTITRWQPQLTLGFTMHMTHKVMFYLDSSHCISQIPLYKYSLVNH